MKAFETRGNSMTVVEDTFRVYVGEAIPGNFDSGQLYDFAAQVYGKLGEHRRFMYQPPRRRILEGMEHGDFVLVLNDAGLVAATSHVRLAKDRMEHKRELGGVLASRGYGKLVVEQGVALAFSNPDVSIVEALVAQKNTGAQAFFRGIEGVEPAGERLSDYVKDEDGASQMTVFDLSALGRQERSV